MWFSGPPVYVAISRIPSSWWVCDVRWERGDNFPTIFMGPLMVVPW